MKKAVGDAKNKKESGPVIFKDLRNPDRILFFFISESEILIDGESASKVFLK